MNDYSKIVELLNSSDPEVVILGLTYFDKSELGKLLREDNYSIQDVPMTIYACQNLPELIWTETLGYFIAYIINKYPEFKEFRQFKHKLLLSPF